MKEIKKIKVIFNVEITLLIISLIIAVVFFFNSSEENIATRSWETIMLLAGAGVLYIYFRQKILDSILNYLRGIRLLKKEYFCGKIFSIYTIKRDMSYKEIFSEDFLNELSMSKEDINNFCKNKEKKHQDAVFYFIKKEKGKFYVIEKLIDQKPRTYSLAEENFISSVSSYLIALE